MNIIASQQNIQTDFRSLKLRDKIKLISIMYLTVWMTSPFLAYGTVYRVLALLSIIMWIILELFEKRSVFRKPTPYILVLYLFMLYTIPIIYLVDESTGLNSKIQFYLMLFFLFVYASYQRKSLEILKPVVYLNIVLFTIWMLTTYMWLLVDSHVARIVVRSSEEAMELTTDGVGGFAFINILLVYIVTILALLKNRFQQKKNFTLITVFLIFSVLLAISVVLKAEYSTAVLLMVVSISYFLFYTKSIHKNIIFFLVFVLVFMALREFMVDILQFFQQFTEGTNYRHKLQDSIDSVALGEATGTAGDRAERYTRSITTFLENPLLGIWSRDTVGKHSLLLDTFAQFGFFAGVALIYILFKIPYQILKTHKKNRTLAITVLFLMVALGGLNNIAMSYGFMFYLFYLYIIYRLENT